MRLVALVVAVGGLACSASAFAGWTVASPGDASAAAATVAAGPTPTATVPLLSTTVTVTWPSVASATGYAVTRSDNLGVAQPAGGTCGGTVEGTTCTESLPAGTYRYRVAVRRAGWIGAPGAASLFVTAPGV